MVWKVMKRAELAALIGNLGQRYSSLLGLDLSSGNDREIFKWFLASILFGAPISEDAAMKTFRCFQEHRVLTPKRIVRTGWEGLVRILDEGGYTRYDFKTADKLLQVMQNLLEKYEGSLMLLHDESSNPNNLEKRLKQLGKGIGEVTVSIFLRELRDVWKKADPKPTPLVVLAAKSLGIVKQEADAQTALDQLKSFWTKNRIRGKSFVDFETALVRAGMDLRRKRKAISHVRG
jgi:hypothetical protein